MKNLTIRKMTPMPAAMRFNLNVSGKAGSFIPVMGFFSTNGALAAKSGLGLS